MATKTAFDWDVYKNRKTALQHLKDNCTLMDTIIETEDGSDHELVHGQVISAFGDKINDFINENGVYVDPDDVIFQREDIESKTAARLSEIQSSSEDQTSDDVVVRRQAAWGKWPKRLKRVRLPKVNRYTLSILVECAYTGFIRTDLASGGIWQVLEVADHYDMAEVIRACCYFLVKNLDRTNCVYFYHIGIKHRHPLQRWAWNEIRANFKHILADNLQCMSFGPELAATSGAWPGQPQVGQASSEEHEQRRNNLATIKYEHFEPLLMHDKLNIDDEETIWSAIKLWCGYRPSERADSVGSLLASIRFPRLRRGTEFSARFIWPDPLVRDNGRAQHELAGLDRNHRELLAGSSFGRDGFSLPCSAQPRQLRPRVPHSILLAIGGWQQGQPTTLIESYDMNCNLWFASRKRIMSQLAYHGIENVNGLLYICGGTDGSEILNELFTFDPVRGECSQRPSMRESRCYVSTAHLEGQLLAIGGHNGLQRMKSVESFDLVNEVWSQRQDMNVARSDASACVHAGRVYIAGGLNDQVIESSVEFYNPRDDSWTFIASMLVPRTSFTLLQTSDYLLAIGGNNGSERLASVEMYDFAAKSWCEHSQMRYRRSTFSAAFIEEGKLIVVGGYNGHTPFNQVEMYDCQTGAWTTMQKIRFDRSGLKVVVVRGLPNALDYTYLGSESAGQER